MTGIAIIGAARTPIGRVRGGLSEIRSDHLGAVVLNAVTDRAGVDPAEVEDVVMGCVTAVGEQSGNIGRTSLLSAGWPESIPGTTVDRRCGSSEAAIHMGVGEIASGAFDIVAAGGAENMSRVKMGGNKEIYGEQFGWALQERFPQISQGEAAERIADKWGFGRDQLDDYASESHRRAAAATDAGYFDREIAPVPVMQWRQHDAVGTIESLSHDETIRRDTSREKLSGLKPAFRPDGKVTAGNSSQISDGAAAVLLMAEENARARGLKVRARVRAVTTVGSDPTLMLLGPIAATAKVLSKAGLTLDDIDLFEVNEAFAPVPLVWMQETGVSFDKLNVNGGAIALGHPLGASGARIMTSLLHEMERRGVRYGLQAICCAGGLGTATILERVD
ncbi:thiolase family protein [Novosphingobium sp. BL-52-GroH]|uniref:thiolase family protein n=1 Tax=Novosphingobium sp. BL-52-GroH TaxID=3349877 RepID=UPI00384E108C